MGFIIEIYRMVPVGLLAWLNLLMGSLFAFFVVWRLSAFTTAHNKLHDKHEDVAIATAENKGSLDMFEKLVIRGKKK